MSVALEPDQRATTDRVRIAHAYCVCQKPLGPGSQALCGHIKQNGPQPVAPGDHSDRCVVCDDLFVRPPCSLCGRRWLT